MRPKSFDSLVKNEYEIVFIGDNTFINNVPTIKMSVISADPIEAIRKATDICPEGFAFLSIRKLCSVEK